MDIKKLIKHANFVHVQRHFLSPYNSRSLVNESSHLTKPMFHLSTINNHSFDWQYKYFCAKNIFAFYWNKT